LEVVEVLEFIIVEVVEPEAIQVVPSLQLQQHTLLLLVVEVLEFPTLVVQEVVEVQVEFPQLLVLD
jgi:hypothetical protein